MAVAKKMWISAMAGVLATGLTVSLIGQRLQAQEIIIDPSTPGLNSTTLRSSGGGKPQIDIATPDSGVSHNKFQKYNVGPDGLILNNSAAGGNSVIGGAVNANSNLSTSGSASVILNEVTGTGTSSLTGITEIFGGKASVIIANPNGVGCNGCSFINTNRSTLTSGVPNITAGGQIDLLATKGMVSVGSGGFTSEGDADLIGRHVTIGGPVNADTTLTISGGAQTFNYNAGTSQAAPTTNAQQSPFAVDATSLGALTAGNIRIHGNEVGLGVNAYGNIDATGNLNLSSKGNLHYGNVQSTGTGQIDAQGSVRQYGNAQFGGNVTVSGNDFTLYRDRTLSSGGDVTINTDDFAVVIGEISGTNVTINVDGKFTNNGFVFADQELVVIAGEEVLNQRQVATEYDSYFDPALRAYIEAYQQQLLDGGPEADLAAEMLARAQVNEVLDEYVLKGATFGATNIGVTANLDLVNRGGAIAATNNITLASLTGSIINDYQTTLHRIDEDENVGCEQTSCGYRSEFHAGEILAGGDLTLTAALDVKNLGSDIAAAGFINIGAGRDVINALTSEGYIVDGAKTFLSDGHFPGGYVTECNATKNGSNCNTNYVAPYDYVNEDTYDSHDQQFVLVPSRIVTLNGDVTILAGNDFNSIGSQISTGGDLIITAGNDALFTSFTGLEDDYLQYYETHTTTTETKEGATVTHTEQVLVQVDDFKFRTSLSDLVARNISITADRDIKVSGGRFLAQADLSLTATTGSILIDSADLPDGAVLPDYDSETAGQFVELGQIFAQGSSLAFDASATTTSYTDDVYRLYQTILGREADLGGLIGKVGQLDGAQTKEDMALEFLNSLEFTTTFGTLDNTQFVTQLYSNAFGRTPAAGELGYWVGQLDAATATRQQVALGIADSDEAITATQASLLAFTSTNASAATILGDADTTQAYATYIANADLLTAVDALKNAGGGFAIRTAARSVGLQSFDTLFGDIDVETAIAQANAAFALARTQANAALAQHQVDVAAYYQSVQTQIADLTSLLGLTQAELDAVIQGELVSVTQAHNTDLTVIEASYQAALQTSENQYGPDIAYYQDLADNAWGNFLKNYYEGKRDEFIVLRDAANAAALSQRDTDRNTAIAAYDLVVVQTAATIAANADPTYINQTVTQLEADLVTQEAVFVTQSEQIFAEAIAKGESVVALQNLVGELDSLGHLAIAKGGVNKIRPLPVTVTTSAGSGEALDYNNDNSDIWTTGTDGRHWWTADYGDDATPVIATYSITAGQTNAGTDSPRDWWLQGSNDNGTWTTLDVVEDQTGWSAGETRNYTLSNTGSYRYYRLANVGAKNDNSNWVRIAKLDLRIADIAAYDNLAEALNTEFATSATQRDDLIADADWRFATDGGLKGLSLTNRSVVYGGGNVAVKAEVDIYLAGATTVSSGDDLSLTAGRRIGALAADNSEFRLNSTAYNAFTQIGERLQEGTLLRDAYTVEADALTEEFLGEVHETDANFETATANYSLSPLTVIAGGGLTLSAGEDMLNFAGSFASGDELIVTAGRDIRNEALRNNFTLTEEDGCVSRACGGQGHDYRAGEMLSGSTALLSAGRDIRVYGGVVSAAASVLAQAEGDIEADAITSQFLYYYTKSSSFLGLNKSKKKLYRAIIQEGEFSTQYGDINLIAGADLNITGSRVLAGGDVHLEAGNDINLLAKSEEVHNYYKKSGFGFFYYASDTVRYNEFATALAEINGQNITALADNNLTGIGAALFAADDIYLDAVENVTFDAHQNVRYVAQSGWSLGVQFAGSNILKAAFESNGDALTVLEAYIGDNPALAAVHRLATSRGGWDTVNGLIGAGYAISSVGADVAADFGRVGSTSGLREAFARQLNPFDELGNLSLNPSSESFLNGITFRLGVYESREEWTESHISSVAAGRDLTIFAGNDIALVGGTVASAGRDNTLDAGNNLVISALADTWRSENYSWGASIGVSPGGWTFGADYSAGTASQQLYTNAAVTAGRTLSMYAGQDIAIAGADIHAGLSEDQVRVQPATGSVSSDNNGTTDATALANGEWISSAGNGSWWEADYGQGSTTEVHAYSITAVDDYFADGSPGRWVLQGSNDDGTWVDLDVVTAQTGWTAGEKRTFTIDTPGSYRKYRLADMYAQTDGHWMRTAAIDLKTEDFNGEIYINAGRDLVVASKQNTAESNSFGFGFTISTSGAFSLSGNLAYADRRYTDTPTIIEAEDRLDIYVGGKTYLLGAALNSRTNNLRLDTGDFLFDNYQDSDTAVTVSASVGTASTHGWNGSFGASYADKQGVTFATVGQGDIHIRNSAQQNINALNRTIGEMQRVTSKTDFAIEIPGLNFAKLAADIEATGNLLRAVGASIPDSIRQQGQQAINIYQRLIVNGYTAQEARAVAATSQFRALANAFTELDKAISVYGSVEAIPLEVRQALALGESMLYTGLGANAVARVRVECGLFGTNCELSLEAYKKIQDQNPQILTTLLNSTEAEIAAYLANPTSDLLSVTRAFESLMLACTTSPEGPQILSRLYAQQPYLFNALLASSGRYEVHGVVSAIAKFDDVGDASAFVGEIEGAILGAAIFDRVAAIVSATVKPVGVLVASAGGDLVVNDDGTINLYQYPDGRLGYLYENSLTGEYFVSNGSATIEAANEIALLGIGGSSFTPTLKGVIVGSGGIRTASGTIIRPAIGFTEEVAQSALTGMRNGGGHAIIHFQHDGIISKVGSLAARVDEFKNLVTPFLTNPNFTAPWRVGVTQGRAFLREHNGETLAVVVARDGPFKGKVISAFKPDPVQLHIMRGGV